MKVLTICIPTYNRSEHIINQLHFLKTHELEFGQFIDIKVADNCSDSIHQNALKQYHLQNPFFEMYFNNENLGLIGNIYFLLELTKSKYVWFLGDDDILLEGIIDRILKIINNEFFTYYLFLNHYTFIDDPDNFDSTIDLCNYSGKVLNGKQCLIDLFCSNGPVNMFMSSCIYSVETLRDFVKKERKMLIIDPLLFSFYAATVNDVYIENEIYVKDRLSGTSWSKDTVAIFSSMLPYGLTELKNFNYSDNEIKLMLVKYYSSYKGNYIRMLVEGPSFFKKNIVYLLGTAQIRLLVYSFFYNVKAVLGRAF